MKRQALGCLGFIVVFAVDMAATKGVYDMMLAIAPQDAVGVAFLFSVVLWVGLLWGIVKVNGYRNKP